MSCLPGKKSFRISVGLKVTSTAIADEIPLLRFILAAFSTFFFEGVWCGWVSDLRISPSQSCSSHTLLGPVFIGTCLTHNPKPTTCRHPGIHHQGLNLLRFDVIWTPPKSYKKNTKPRGITGCPGTEVDGSMVRINGQFHLHINGVYWGCYNPLILTLLEY